MNSELTPRTSITICFDLDGTLCDTDETIPIPERYYKATPKQHMIEIVNRFYNKGHNVVIDTARASGATCMTRFIKKYKLTQLTRNQLNKWGIKYTTLRVGKKTPADIYIDDRCLPPKIFDK